MENKVLVNKCVKSLMVVALAIVAFYLFVYPRIGKYSEGFADTKDKEASQTTKGPFHDKETGSLMDGPEMENPKIEKPTDNAPNGIPDNYYLLDDGSNGSMSIQNNLCSRSCCSEQYPTPHKLSHDAAVCGNKNEYVPSQVMCNNAFQDSGCLCLTKDQAKFLTSRGGNA